MNNVKIYVLKDEKDNYVGINSISHDKKTRKYIYSFSKRFVNGFYTYTDKSDAVVDLNLLEEKGLKINFENNFHIEKINMLEVSINESKLGIEQYPIQHKVIKVDRKDPNKNVNCRGVYELGI
jgi:hypothetical protein